MKNLEGGKCILLVHGFKGFKGDVSGIWMTKKNDELSIIWLTVIDCSHRTRWNSDFFPDGNRELIFFLLAEFSSASGAFGRGNIHVPAFRTGNNVILQIRFFSLRFHLDTERIPALGALDRNSCGWDLRDIWNIELKHRLAFWALCLHRFPQLNEPAWGPCLILSSLILHFCGNESSFDVNDSKAESHFMQDFVCHTSVFGFQCHSARNTMYG